MSQPRSTTLPATDSLAPRGTPNDHSGDSQGEPAAGVVVPGPVYTWSAPRRRVERPANAAEQYATFSWMYWRLRSDFVSAVEAYRLAKDEADRCRTRTVELPLNALYVDGKGWVEMPTLDDQDQWSIARAS